jgi:selenide,water dikinase
MLLFDPQTSGGLLLGVPKEKLDPLFARAKELSQPVWEIGHVETGAGINIR